MVKINIYHLFAIAGFNTLSMSKKRKKYKKRRERRYWIRPLFANRATSGAYQSLALKMKEIDKKFFGGLFACHPIDLTIY